MPGRTCTYRQIHIKVGIIVIGEMHRPRFSDLYLPFVTEAPEWRGVHVFVYGEVVEAVEMDISCSHVGEGPTGGLYFIYVGRFSNVYVNCCVLCHC